MEATWYALISLMLTTYVVLDGFDFGAGTAHLFVARTDDERRLVFSAIGPLWDGNEVWLVASGGVLVFAFPRAYAVAFSGFYLPLMMVLWLFILRGISIEFRSQQSNPLWRAFWDAGFAFSSSAIAIVLGAALGNVIRGVPIEPGGYFNGPLFTDFHASGRAGILDWFTLLLGIYALITLTAHGATFLAWKVAGPVGERSNQLARRAWLTVTASSIPVTIAIAYVQPTLMHQFARRPAAWPLLIIALGSLVTIHWALRRNRDRIAFLASCGFIVGLLLSTAAALYPTILRSTLDESLTLTAHNSSTGHAGLVIGLIWWTPAVALAIAYFVYLFRSFKGKVSNSDYHV